MLFGTVRVCGRVVAGIGGGAFDATVFEDLSGHREPSAGARLAGSYRWQAHRRQPLARLIQYPEGFPGTSQVAGQERETGRTRK